MVVELRSATQLVLKGQRRQPVEGGPGVLVIESAGRYAGWRVWLEASGEIEYMGDAEVRERFPVVDDPRAR